MNAYTLAKERYAALGVDTEAVLETLKNVTVSVHCWQGDDVVGFDAKEALSGGIQTTGNYPGKATTPEQLMADFDEVLRLTPGKKKLNLHASYAIFEDGEFADRDAIQPKHFPAGSPMPRSAVSASTLTRHSSLIPWSRTA